MGKQKGRALKKNQAAAASAEAAEHVNAPHSFVLHRGLSCPYIVDLTLDYRRMMEPFTASALRERRSNKIKDFISLSGVFHVSHMCIFNKTKSQLSYKVARLPRGPTLTFKVHQFTLARDVIASTRKQFVDEEAFHHAPLIILNNFTGEGKHLKLMATTFQNMYPTINLATVQLSTIKRCVLISYNPVTELCDVRHYAVTVAPVGLSRNIKKVVMGKIPNLSRCEDIADFLAAGNLTDSEFEDDETGHVVLPQTLKSRGNVENNKSAVKLHEIGPRLTLELSKIEDGLFKGEVLFHRRIIKTEEELAAIAEERAAKKAAKAERRRLQELNKDANEQAREDHKRRSQKHGGGERFDRNETQASDDDDAAYYEQEVGQKPDEELFVRREYASGGNKRAYTPKYMGGSKDAAKRRRTDGGGDGDGDKPAAKRPLNGYQGKKYDAQKAAGNRNNDRLDERDLKRRPGAGRGKKATGSKAKTSHGNKGKKKGGRR